MGLVHYGQRGYSGCSRSDGAERAEEADKLPLTRAVSELARRCHITRKESRRLLEANGPSEWHHTGKYAARTDYYDLGEAEQRMEREAVAALLPSGWQEKITAAIQSVTMRQNESGEGDMDRRYWALNIATYRLMCDSGVSEEVINDAYYYL